METGNKNTLPLNVLKEDFEKVFEHLEAFSDIKVEVKYELKEEIVTIELICSSEEEVAQLSELLENFK